MLDLLKNIISYELAIGISILSPIIFYFYRTWLKSRYDKKLEKIKSELAKENNKHEARLNNYKEYYKKIDETQKKMNELAQLFSERISEKATDIANNGTFSDVMNSNHYIEIYSKLFEETNSLTLQLIVQTNEFKFYASDKLIELIEKLESKYSEYFKISVDDNLKTFQEVFEKAKNFNFTEIYSSINSININTKAIELQSEITIIQERIKKEMRKELGLNN